MTGFNNPFFEIRGMSPGELAQQYASFFQMASLFFGLSFTDKEKEAIPIVIGALMRERGKVDIVKLFKTLEGFIPKA
jgi:hypothetical protein